MRFLGLRPRAEANLRYQKKYAVCTVVCAAAVLTERVLQWKLIPWLQAYKMTYFGVWPSLLYGMAVQLLAALAAGVLLPAAVSLEGYPHLGPALPPGAFDGGAAVSVAAGRSGPVASDDRRENVGTPPSDMPIYQRFSIIYC